MGRHQIPRHLRRRLIAAGTAAVCILGTAVGIGIFGAAQADNEAAPRPVPCLPDVPPAPPSETVPPEESAPPEEPPAEEPPAEEPPAEQPPAEEPPAEEPPAEEPPAEESATQGLGLTSAQGARPRGPQQSEEQPPPAEEPPAEEPPAEQPPAEQPPAEEPPVSTDPNEVPGEQGPPPAETVPPVPPDAPEDDFGNEECTNELGPFPQDFVNIRRVGVNNLAARPPAGTGTFVSRCGTNPERHLNSDNFITSPGVVNGAHHLHDYVGNTDASATSTDESLAAADTTCRLGDKSTYFWPVLRLRDADGGGAPDEQNAHNVGEILRPSSVKLQFRGNAQSDVVAMPQFLRVLTGNAKAQTQGGTNANAKWTCTGFTNRITDKYPLCPRGSQVQRIADFPSCWDGENTDSANHRSHTAFPDRAGNCPDGFVAIPQLRITLNYSIPRGSVYAVDAFPDELHSPVTDHNDFVNVMPTRLMDRVVRCINSGRNC